MIITATRSRSARLFALTWGAVWGSARCSLLGFLLCASAPAQTTLELDAPPEIAAVLRTHLAYFRLSAQAQPEALALRAAVRGAPKAAEEILQAEGWFSATISTPTKDGDGWVLRVEPGPRAQVREVTLEFVGGPDGGAAAPVPERRIQAWRAGWLMAPGSAFRSEDWENAKRKLLTAVRSKDYAVARITDTRAEVDASTATVDLWVQIETGPEFSMGPLRLQGLNRYPESFVHALLGWEGTAPFDQAVLNEWQSRLIDSQYFVSVSVLPAFDATQGGSVPIDIQLDERKSKRLTYALGASSDDGPRLKLSYEDRTFADGVNWLSTALLVQQHQQKMEARLAQPWDARQQQDALHARIEHLYQDDEDIERGALGVSRTWRTDKDLDRVLGLDYQFERVSLAEAPGVWRQALTLGHSWNWRRVDNRVNPNRGYTLNLQISGASRLLASDTSFVRAFAKSLRFFRAPANGRFIVSMEAGGVWTPEKDNVPTENLFKAGGTQSVRGYPYRSLGVLSNGSTVGGRYIAVASAEYQYPVSPAWSLATFVDVGDVVDRTEDWRGHWGYGMGARIQTPLGPVNLDLGFNQQDSGPRLHFSVGYAF